MFNYMILDNGTLSLITFPLSAKNSTKSMLRRASQQDIKKEGGRVNFEEK
jgi:hypothetical protein